MTHVGYLIAGWGAAFVIVGTYIWSVLRRSKQLAERVPPEHQRWISSSDASRIGDA